MRKSKGICLILFALFIHILFPEFFYVLYAIVIAILGPKGSSTSTIDSLINTFEQIDFIKFEAFNLSISIVIMVFAYYKLFSNKDNKLATRTYLTKGNVTFTIAIALGMNFVTDLVLNLFNTFSPEMIESYVKLIEDGGVGQEIFMAALSTVVLAPILEELVYRGFIQQSLTNMGIPFWIANITQSLIFGFIHMNLIQGVYAFILGLIIGYIYHLTKSLIAVIILHMSYNLFGSYLDISSENGTLSNFIAIFIPIIGVCITIYAVKKIQQYYKLNSEKVHK